MQVEFRFVGQKLEPFLTAWPICREQISVVCLQMMVLKNPLLRDHASIDEAVLKRIVNRVSFFQVIGYVLKRELGNFRSGEPFPPPIKLLRAIGPVALDQDSQQK